MSVVLGRCDFRTIFILVICISIRVILHKERTQFEQSIQREEYDTQCERVTTWVINAAATNNPTIACRLYLWKNERFNKPIFDNSHETNGISKTIPITKISIRKLSIYESKETCSVILHSTDKLPKSAASSGIP